MRPPTTALCSVGLEPSFRHTWQLQVSDSPGSISRKLASVVLLVDRLGRSAAGLSASTTRARFEALLMHLTLTLLLNGLSTLGSLDLFASIAVAWVVSWRSECTHGAQV